MQIIYLIGFMGSGKTTVGRALSEALQEQAVDIDVEIESSLGKKIVDIFQDEGECGFRIHETATLRSLQHIPIISTGGGIVERQENITYMKETGVIVYLKASYELIAKRLSGDSSRPLWQGNQEKRALYQRRITMYAACADVTVDCNKLTLEEQVDFILSQVKV